MANLAGSGTALAHVILDCTDTLAVIQRYELLTLNRIQLVSMFCRNFFNFSQVKVFNAYKS